jgi:hypothetical protein
MKLPLPTAGDIAPTLRLHYAPGLAVSDREFDVT